ncbi:MAG: flagellar biosynthetic protein FliO [Rhodospirillaceae bacterium]|nr:flagellar biosynthetic protein FliO [Rhodospirillaceae bacterium]
MTFDLYLRFAAALAFVLALIAVVGWIARRAGLGARLPRGGGRQRRMGLVEVLPLDAKRRLVLVRRDGVEHLLLVGPAGDLVVEHGIMPAGGDGDSDAGREPAAPAPSFRSLLAGTAGDPT